jgi:hypothetical protein
MGIQQNAEMMCPQPQPQSIDAFTLTSTWTCIFMTLYTTPSWIYVNCFYISYKHTLKCYCLQFSDNTQPISNGKQHNFHSVVLDNRRVEVVHLSGQFSSPSVPPQFCLPVSRSVCFGRKDASASFEDQTLPKDIVYDNQSSPFQQTIAAKTRFDVIQSI